MLRMLVTLIFALLALAPLVVAPAAAQQIEIKAKPPEQAPKLEILPPPGAKEITRPRESDFYPDDIRVRLDPAFIEPFAAVKQTGPNSAVQMGLAGWTSPNTPVPQGADAFRDDPGWFALGFAIVWDVPVNQGRRAAPTGPPK